MRTQDIEQAVEATQRLHRHLIEAVSAPNASRHIKLGSADAELMQIAAMMGFRVERFDYARDDQTGITSAVARN